MNASSTFAARPRRRRLWWILLPLFAMALLVAGLVFMATVFGWAGIGWHDLQVSVDGTPVDVQLSGWHALAAGGGLLVALLVVVLVVPLALLFGLALPVIVCGLLAAIAVAAVLGVGLLLLAPLLVPVGLLLWWWTRSRRAQSAASGAAAAGSSGGAGAPGAGRIE